jgi:WD40 repeat protein
VAVATAGERCYLFDAATGRAAVILEGDRGHSIEGAEFSPDGRRILTRSDVDSTGLLTLGRGEPTPKGLLHWLARGKPTAKGLLLWDATTGRRLRALLPSQPQTEGEFSWVECSPNGRRVLAAHSDRTVRIWDADSGKEILILRGHTDRVNCAVFSPDGSRVLTASDDRTARIWDAATGKELRVLRGHESGPGVWQHGVLRARFSRDGKRIVTAGKEGTARLWDAATGQPLAAWKGHDSWVLSAAFSKDGRWVVTENQNGRSRVWPVDPLSVALQRRPRELTAEERQRYGIGGLAEE